MAEPNNDQTLAATFVFGTVAIAAIAATFLYLRGSASSLFRDALRLVLVGYLAASFLWALTGFIATFIQPSALSGCQIAVAIAAVFDELARILLEEFLFWAIKFETKASIGLLLPQGVLFARFVLGAVFVGLQRPQFNPVCVGVASVTPVAIVVLVLDAGILVMLLTRAYSAGIFKDIQQKTSAGARGRLLLLITLAAGLWTAVSIPMILGLESFGLAVRTVLPALGALIAIVLVAIFRKNFDKTSTGKASQGPQMTEGPVRGLAPPSGGLATRNLINQDVSSSYTSNRFSATPRDGPSSSGSDRTFASRSGTAGLPIISRPNPGQTDAGVGGVPVTGELFPPINIRAAQAAASRNNERPIKEVSLRGVKVAISYPVLNTVDELGPAQRVPTVDLATAAREQKERREKVNPKPPSSHSRGSPKPMSIREMQDQPQTFKRKEVGLSMGTTSPDVRKSLPLNKEPPTKGDTSLIQSSTTVDNVRRRSPTSGSHHFPDLSSSPAVTQKNHPAPDAGASTTSTPQSPRAVKPQPRLPDDESKETIPPTSASPRPSPSKESTYANPILPSSTPGKLSLSTQSMDVLVLPVPPLGMKETPELPHKKTAVSDSIRGTLASLPRNGSVKTDIRPSRQRPVSPPSEAQPSAAKKPVELRRTNGIPSNPKARFPKPTTQEHMALTDTPKGFEDSEEDASAGRGIMDQALKAIAEKPPRVRGQGRDSVLNRPRPVPRKPSGHIFPSSGFPQNYGRNSDRISAFTEAEPITASMDAVEPLHSQNLGPESQDPSPAVPRDKGDRQRTPPAVSDMSATAPTLSINEADDLKPSGREETSTTNRIPNAPTRAPRSHHSTGRFLYKSSLNINVGAFDKQTNGPLETLPAISRSPPSLQDDKRDMARSPSLAVPDDLQSSLDAKNLDANGSSKLSQPPQPMTETLAAQAELSNTTAEAQVWPDPVDRRHQVESALLTDDEDEGKETMTVMLDVPVESRTASGRQMSAGSLLDGGSWHRRVGEKCPTFSDKRMTSTRLVPRPPPLSLGKPSKKSTAAAELPALESPQQTLEKIQEQLSKLGELVEHPAAGKDQQQQHPECSGSQDNFQRLADLEEEMGMQEDRWQEMRRDYSRASVSTLQSSPGTGPSTAKLDNMILAADGESMGLEAPSDLDTGALGLGELGNPFPSPSDLEKWALGGSEGTSSIRAPRINSTNPLTATSLPLSSSNARPDVTGSLDDSSDRRTDVGVLPLEPALPPTLETLQRPVTRQSEGSKDEGPIPRSTSAPANEAQSTERPRTKKPPRRSRRVSSLPDIVEDPVPIVGKRGTLGIFQFPWGEMSESGAAPLSSQMDAAMNTNMAVGVPFFNMAPGMPPVFPTLDAQVRTLHPQDYPSSFFEDYDDEEAARNEYSVSSDGEGLDEDADEEEEEEDGGNDDDDDDDDDSFDEATLWEIANLLKSDKVPSRGSLFPEADMGPRSRYSSGASRPQARDSMTDSQGTATWETRDSAKIEVRDAEAFSQSPSAPIDGESPLRYQPAPATLWDGKPSEDSAAKTMGLPQSSTTWSSYIARASGNVRANVRIAEPAALASNALWPAAVQETVPMRPQSAAGLWHSTTAVANSRVVQAICTVDLKEQETVSEVLPFFLDVTPYSQANFTEPSFHVSAEPSQTAETSHHASEIVPVRVAPRQASPMPFDEESPRALHSSFAMDMGEVAVMDSRSDERLVLWTPPEAPKSGHSRGLFKMHHGCDTKLGSMLEPAALKMRPNNLGTSSLASETLESTGLWLPPSNLPLGYDWLSLSTTRPSTPETTSVVWDNGSPFTDASSIHSSDTGLSMADGNLSARCVEDMTSSSPRQEGVFGDDDGDMEPAAQEPEGPIRTSQPVLQADGEAALDEALAASDPGSTGLVSAPVDPPAVASERAVNVSEEVAVTSERVVEANEGAADARRVEVGAASEVGAAASDGVVAACEETAVARVETVTASDEVADEDESLPPGGGFATSTMHPVFLKSDFDTSEGTADAARVEVTAANDGVVAASEESTVASEEVANGDESLPPGGGFDTSTIHPVFLTSDFDTSAGNVHPAASGY